MNSPTAICQLPSAPRIVVRGTNWLGDAVMTTPALMRLREKFPDAHIVLLTPEKLKDLWRHHPAIDEIIAFTTDDSVWQVASKLQISMRPAEECVEDVANFGKSLKQQDPEQIQDSAKRALFSFSLFRRRTFDLALVLPNSPRSALEVWLAGIPQRIGYARPWRNWFLTNAVPARAEAVKMQKRSVGEINSLISGTGFQPVRMGEDTGWKPVPPSNAHQIHEYLHLAAALGASPEPMPPQLFVTPGEIEAAKKKFGLNEIKRPLFGLNPGAEYGPAKRWPVDKFIAVAHDIQQRTNCTWLVFGGKADEAVARRIESAIPSPPTAIFDFAGKTSLRELMALLKICRVLLTNDSGPMHVAAALGTPVVVPFGSTSPELTGPGLPGDARHRLLKSDAPCSPCFLRECPIDFRCLNGITVERVVEAVLSLV
jgi:heptosyltransferase-2